MTGMLLARLSRGQGPEDRVIVVDVSSRAASLQPDDLRARIGSELHASAIAPEDPRAPSATGTLTIDVDREKGELSITYLARATPIARRIPLPADGAQARSAAVLLAGNLARDEASELAAELRKPRAGDAATPATTAAKAPQETTAPRAVRRDEEEEKDFERQHLQDILEENARNQHNTRMAVGGMTLGAGMIVTATGLTISRLHPGIVLDAGTSGAFLMTYGILELSLKTPLERLAQHGREGAGRLVLEAEWAHQANRERKTRHVVGGLALVASAACFGAVGSLLALRGSNQTDGVAAWEYEALVQGTFAGVFSVVMLASPGPVESSLRSYEKATGHVLSPGPGAAVHPYITPVAGGGVLGGLSGVF